MEIITSVKSFKPMRQQNIGWINGKWGHLEDLVVSIEDRGLRYADGIFETILIAQGKAKLLTAHISRWEQSAKRLGMALPPSEDWLHPIIQESIKRSSLEIGYGALRLNWSRGKSQNRMIYPISDKKTNSNHQFWLELKPITPSFKPVSAIISCREKRNANSNLSSCKTFAYGQSIQTQREATELGYDEGLLENTNGDLCCGSTSNIIINRHDKLLTPSLESGCLPGIMRQQGLDNEILHEEKLSTLPNQNDQWLLINSLGCRPIYKLNKINLSLFANPKDFWLSLYSL